MRITRDSFVLVLTTVGSYLGFLLYQPPPVEWTYHQWIQAGIVLLGMITAQLSTSPLKGEHDGQ